ncbi:nucleoside-diphosphate-sugar epimerase [Hasllibacter halocynthiae]|uniref:Nucleoside-diphosphate-sugar epimerase n=1 Tax=Hasllibacter halocynthiae TaxID=595589 RepID=A0A2T0X352_9RHOB|nr:SDR family oxidoreductase [Hasllibacter halocynthiae]PRY93379.1 nucleoside-diphosphate-sugar epimerase [Hasllibacter halocynthiae]
MPTLLSFGHGYSARALARRLEGWRVIGTTRSEEKAEALRAEGVGALIWPGEGDVPVEEATHLLSSVSPGPEGDPVLAAFGSRIAAHAPRLRWAGYLSTIGVYGDREGGWVDEESELRPTTDRGRARVRAEEAWRAVPGLPLHVFRLAGIYGPGRGPFEKVRRGTARRIVKPGQVFGRIHREDIASALLASIRAPDPGAIYNLSDDEPAPPQDVIAEAARLLGVPVPPEVPFEEADLSPMARSFYAESKRVRNDRMRALMGPLAFPTYREGLAALLAEEKGQAR